MWLILHHALALLRLCRKPPPLRMGRRIHSAGWRIPLTIGQRLDVAGWLSQQIGGGLHRRRHDTTMAHVVCRKHIQSRQILLWQFLFRWLLNTTHNLLNEIEAIASEQWVHKDNALFKRCIAVSLTFRHTMKAIQIELTNKRSKVRMFKMFGQHFSGKCTRVKHNEGGLIGAPLQKLAVSFVFQQAVDVSSARLCSTSTKKNKSSRVKFGNEKG